MDKVIKVVTTTRSEALMEEYDYRDNIEITVDGAIKFGVHDGEPEDNNMGRNFSDCYAISALMQNMYELGKAGVQVEFEDVEEED